MRLSGVASLITWIWGGVVGDGRPLASSVSVTAMPCGLVAVTVTMSVWEAPASPVKGAVNEQV